MLPWWRAMCCFSFLPVLPFLSSLVSLSASSAKLWVSPTPSLSRACSGALLQGPSRRMCSPIYLLFLLLSPPPGSNMALRCGTTCLAPIGPAHPFRLSSHSQFPSLLPPRQALTLPEVLCSSSSASKIIVILWNVSHPCLCLPPCFFCLPPLCPLVLSMTSLVTMAMSHM